MTIGVDFFSVELLRFLCRTSQKPIIEILWSLMARKICEQCLLLIIGIKGIINYLISFVFAARKRIKIKSELIYCTVFFSMITFQLVFRVIRNSLNLQVRPFGQWIVQILLFSRASSSNLSHYFRSGFCYYFYLPYSPTLSTNTKSSIFALLFPF